MSKRYNKDNKRSYAIPYFGNYAPDGGPTFVFGHYGTSSPTEFIGVNMAAVPEPSTTILLVEAPSPNNNFGYNQLSWAQAPISGMFGQTITQDAANPGKPIHMGGWNYLFCDGHVKWLRPEQTIIGVTTNLSQQVPGNMWARFKS